MQVPIEDWEQLRRKYPDIEIPPYSLPNWQKELVDMRLQSVNENPDRILTINSLLSEFNSSID